MSKRKQRSRKAVRNSNDQDEIVDVRCGCGWAKVGVPISAAPSSCPLCGMAFDREVWVGADMAANPGREVQFPRRRDWWTRRNAGHAGGIVGWTYDGAVYCTDHKPKRTSSADDRPTPILDVQDEGWETDTCDECGETLGDVEGVVMDNPRRARRNSPALPALPRHLRSHTCPPDGTNQRGQCAGYCDECGEHALVTGRYTAYCPSCHTCEACGCPEADGFSHYEGCRLGSGTSNPDVNLGIMPLGGGQSLPAPLTLEQAKARAIQNAKTHMEDKVVIQDVDRSGRYVVRPLGSFPWSDVKDGRVRLPGGLVSPVYLIAWSGGEITEIPRGGLKGNPLDSREQAAMLSSASVAESTARRETDPFNRGHGFGKAQAYRAAAHDYGPGGPSSRGVFAHNPRGRGRKRRNISSPGGGTLVVEVAYGLEGVGPSIDDLLADPSTTDEQIDAALAGFDPARTFEVRADVERILEIAGISARCQSGGDPESDFIVFSYEIPSTHNPELVAKAVRKYFEGQKDVKVSLH